MRPVSVSRDRLICGRHDSPCCGVGKHPLAGFYLDDRAMTLLVPFSAAARARLIPPHSRRVTILQETAVEKIPDQVWTPSERDCQRRRAIHIGVAAEVYPAIDSEAPDRELRIVLRLRAIIRERTCTQVSRDVPTTRGESSNALHFDPQLRRRRKCHMLRTNIILLVLTVTFGCPLARAQETKLTVPAYHNLPTTEGYFQGTGGVRLFYRVAGGTGDPIVFLHGGPGVRSTLAATTWSRWRSAGTVC
jgi:hypothetical protein